MQSQISWLLQKPTDLDLHCLQKQGISGLSRTSVNVECQVKEHLVSFFKVFGMAQKHKLPVTTLYQLSHYACTTDYVFLIKVANKMEKLCRKESAATEFLLQGYFEQAYVG